MLPVLLSTISVDPVRNLRKGGMPLEPVVTVITGSYAAPVPKLATALLRI
jgi:hypothetical protein